MKKFSRSLLSSCFLASACIVLAGCGGAGDDVLDLAKVSGNVTLDGTPVPNAQVIFMPETGPVAMGKTDDQGNYTLGTKTTDDGAVVGIHKVSVTQASSVSSSSSPSGADAYAIPSKKAEKGGIPTKYADANTSKLTATVKAGEENSVPLKLDSK